MPRDQLVAGIIGLVIGLVVGWRVAWYSFPALLGRIHAWSVRGSVGQYKRRRRR